MISMFFKPKRNKVKNVSLPVVYYCDDYEHTREVMKRNDGVLVEYHAVRTKINPAYCYVMGDGHKLWQYNSEYVAYLKRLIPDIKIEEAYAYIDYLLKRQDDTKSIRSDVALETIVNIDEIVKEDESKRTYYGHYGNSSEECMSNSEGKKLIRGNKNRKDDLF